MAREKRIDPPKAYPLFGWTPTATREYIEKRPLVRGDLMIIYNGQAGFHQYALAEVQNPSAGRQKRVILSKAAHYGGTSFYRTGQNCYSPKGQSRMIPPVPALIEHLAFDCDVSLKGLPYASGEA